MNQHATLSLPLPSCIDQGAWFANPHWGKKGIATGLALLCHAGLLWSLLLKPAILPPRAMPMASFEMVTLPEPPKPVVEPPPVAQPPPSPPAAPAPAAPQLKPLPQPVAKALPARPSRPPAPARASKPAPAVTADSPPRQTAAPPQAKPVAPVETYIPPSSKAAYLENPKPVYPAFARRQGTEGVVLLSVEVDSTGLPLTVALKQSSGHELLDRAALQAVQQWRFVPAQRGGAPVRAQVDVPIRFQLTNG
ncbi:MAG: energy transducer TonB [Magnetococcus sp. DMHC-8]